MAILSKMADYDIFLALGLALSQFGCLLVLQFLWWRVQPPRRHTLALVLLFVALGIAPLPFGMALVADTKMELGLLAHALALYTALFAAYLITYSAIEVDSPSLLIVQKVADAGPSGLASSELRQELGDETLLIPRVEDLVRDRMLEGSPEQYRLTEKGRGFIQIFVFYRSLIRRSLGG